MVSPKGKGNEVCSRVACGVFSGNVNMRLNRTSALQPSLNTPFNR